jgi:hypothetical protein
MIVQTFLAHNRLKKTASMKAKTSHPLIHFSSLWISSVHGDDDDYGVDFKLSDISRSN